jgi:glutamine amidotransferase
MSYADTHLQLQTLKDDMRTVNFAELNNSSDQIAVICTQPLTDDESWIEFTPNELKVFINGKLFG